MKKPPMQNQLFEKKSFIIPLCSKFAGLLISLLTTCIFLQAAKVDKIAAGGSHSLILKDDGSLWTVGSNSNGQLGIGSTTSKSIPVAIEGSNVIEVAAGENHSLYIKSNGVTKELWGMGANVLGQLGDNTGQDQNVSVLIDSVLIDSGDIFSVSADGNHSLYLKSDGTTVSLRGMGNNPDGQLGTLGVNVLSHSEIDSDLGDEANKSSIKIATGDNHSLYLEDNGSLWALGKNDLGQLGDGSNIDQTGVMIEASGVTNISAGGNHSLYIKDSKLWAMGSNAYGQLGDSTNWDRNRPILVPGIVGNVASIHAGRTYSYFTKQDGTVWRMGNNSEGQLGNGTTSSASYPSELTNFSGATISVGGAHALLLKSDKSLWATGHNSSGQLGNETTSSSATPVAMKVYYLTLTVSGTGGSVPDSSNYAYDEIVSISGTPNTGFVFGGWSGGKTSSDNPYTFNIQEDLEISASFSQDIGDNDNDGLTNYEELINLGTNPDDNDTDDDGFNDFDEDRTVGLDPNTANTGLKTFFLEGETAAYATGFVDGNNSGQSYVVANFSSFSLFDQNDINSATTAGETSGINMVTASPSNYSLFAQSDIDSATAAGQTTGINSVTSSPSNYGLFVQSDLDAKFAEGNASGIAYVQANPEKFNFLTDAEKNASYDLGYAAGLAEAEASGLAEAQAKLAVENLSSLTYLDEIRALPQTKPYTEGWYFQPGLGWLWTNNSTFPFIFRQAAEGGEGSWLYFSQLPEQSLKPYYDYDAEKWISASGN